MLRTGQLLAPLKGLCRSASTTRFRPPPGAVLPRTLVSPRTGLSPAGCRELVARFTLRHHLLPLRPELLDAHTIRTFATTSDR